MFKTKRRHIVILVVSFVLVVGATTYSTFSTSKVAGQVDKGFKVWVKTSPCSGGRTEWITVAKTYPGGGGGPDFWSLADRILTPMDCTTQNSECTFTAAMAVADILRTNDQFSNYCCKDYYVWENTTTGEEAIVKGPGSAGFGWRRVSEPLCCEDAELIAGDIGFCARSRESSHTCFAADAGMGSVNREDHLAWAQQQAPAQLEANLLSKIDHIYSCTDITDADFANFFADISVLIARYVQSSACFNNDIGATAIDRSAHYQWARNKSRQSVQQNLKGKVSAAFRCLNNTGRVNLFSDASIPAARISRGTTTAGGLPKATGTATPTTTPIIYPSPSPSTTPSSLPPGTRPCSADERAAFGRMSGSFQTPGGAKITVGGSCEQATGTAVHTDYCENPDATYNQSLKRYQVSFTGGMGGSFLYVQWKNPSDARRPAGGGSCYMGSDGILSCTGFPCRIDGVRK